MKDELPLPAWRWGWEPLNFNPSVQQFHQLTAARRDAVTGLEVDELVTGLAVAGAVLVHIDHWIFLVAFVAFDVA